MSSATRVQRDTNNAGSPGYNLDVKRPHAIVVTILLTALLLVSATFTHEPTPERVADPPPAPAEQGQDPTASQSSRATRHPQLPRPHSEFQDAVRAVAKHDPTGAVWIAYDNCVVLPEAKRYRDEAQVELAVNPALHAHDALAHRKAEADALLVAPYASLCVDAFSWAAAPSPSRPGYTRWGSRLPATPGPPELEN